MLYQEKSGNRGPSIHNFISAGIESLWGGLSFNNRAINYFGSRKSSKSFALRTRVPVQGCQILIGKTYQNGEKYTKRPQNVPIKLTNKIDHTAIKDTNILHYKTMQNLPKMGFWVWKYTVWQPCVLRLSTYLRLRYFELLRTTSNYVELFRSISIYILRTISSTKIFKSD
jgi:hypothetical protein